MVTGISSRTIWLEPTTVLLTLNLLNVIPCIQSLIESNRLGRINTFIQLKIRKLDTRYKRNRNIVLKRFFSKWFTWDYWNFFPLAELSQWNFLKHVSNMHFCTPFRYQRDLHRHCSLPTLSVHILYECYHRNISYHPIGNIQLQSVHYIFGRFCLCLAEPL